MKLTILHDRNGNILKVVAYPADHPPVQFEVAEGQSIAHAEMRELALADRSEIGRRLSQLHSNFRVAENGTLEEKAVAR